MRLLVKIDIHLNLIFNSFKNMFVCRNYFNLLGTFMSNNWDYINYMSNK